jgi:hypothetical protein
MGQFIGCIYATAFGTATFGAGLSGVTLHTLRHSFTSVAGADRHRRSRVGNGTRPHGGVGGSRAERRERPSLRHVVACR